MISHEWCGDVPNLAALVDVWQRHGMSGLRAQHALRGVDEVDHDPEHGPSAQPIRCPPESRLTVGMAVPGGDLPDRARGEVDVLAVVLERLINPL